MGNPVWLVGMMGAGKSAVGPRLARGLGRRFVDSDAEVERAAGATIAEIFAREGEPVFRARERKVIDALSDLDAVVALGGGSIAQPGAAERLAGSGTVIYLKAQPSTLLARIGDCTARPLLRDVSLDQRQARLAGLLEERKAAYESASVIVETDQISIPEVVEEIARRLESGSLGRVTGGRA